MLGRILASANMPARRPVLNDHLESNVRGVFVVGELAGAPVVKLAMEQGVKVARHIASTVDARSARPDAYDVVVIGAGAAGISAALEAKSLGLRVLLIERREIGNTIRELPEGKWIYGEPRDRANAGLLWFEETTKDDLAARWEEQLRNSGLETRVGEAVEGLRREGDILILSTSAGTILAQAVILATGKSANPRRLGVPGDSLPYVQHKLYSPKHYTDEKIVVVGGGNSAVEAALALSERNDVTLVYRGSELARVSKVNREKLDASKVRILYNSQVTQFAPGLCTISQNGKALVLPCTHAWVLIGAEAPETFLRTLGLRLENEWTAARYVTLALCFALAYSIYAIKQSPGFEFWPFTGWGARAFAFFDRPWSFWYTVLYTAVVTIFGLQALKRWGLDRKDRFQTWRYVSLIGFQWTFFFLIPEFLFRWAVQYQWVGASLASDPNFANNAWRSYGLVYAWPLFFYTFLDKPADIWIIWGVLLSFVIIPVLVLFHGKRYCSWICGCGGLAETLGDRWRHLAPKGVASIKWEKMNGVVLAVAVVVTVLALGKDAYQFLHKPADASLRWYHILADTWLVGIIPITLYPFLGGKIWCRYWCPLAKMMELFSAAFTRFKASRFAIDANDKCIACEECSRNCQVGIDVMRYALRQEPITNLNSSCIGCGICITVCPMNVLRFADAKPTGSQLIQIGKAA